MNAPKPRLYAGDVGADQQPAGQADDRGHAGGRAVKRQRPRLAFTLQGCAAGREHLRNQHGGGRALHQPGRDEYADRGRQPAGQGRQDEAGQPRLEQAVPAEAVPQPATEHEHGGVRDTCEPARQPACQRSRRACLNVNENSMYKAEQSWPICARCVSKVRTS